VGETPPVTRFVARSAIGLALVFAALMPAKARGQASGDQPSPAPAPLPPDADRAPPAEPAPTAESAPPEEATSGDVEQGDADTIEPEQGGEVIVIDSRSEKPLGNAIGAVDVVDRAAIRARGARNVGDALRGRIGLEVVPDLRGTAVRAQGFDPAYLLILVDGLPAIGRINGALDVDRLPVTDVERIEVIKGPSSALFGSDALGGVINIVTRDADRPLSAEGSAIYGSRDRIDASATAAMQRRIGSWRLASRAALGMRRADGFDLDPDAAGENGAEERAGDAAVRVAASRGPWRLVAGGDYLRQDLRGVEAGAAPGAIFDRRTLAENGSGTVSAIFRPRDDTSFAATLRHSVFRDQFLYDQRGPADYDYELTEQHLTSAALVGSSLLAPAHLLTGGIDGAAEELTADRLSDDGSRQRLGLYAQDEWLVLRRPQLVLVPGARLDVDSQFGAHPTPKLAARWDVSDKVIARASAGFGYRAPDFRQLLLRFENPSVGYQVEGNPDLDPETSIGGTLSVEVEPISRVSIAAQAYWNDVDDLIAVDLVEPGMDGPPGCPEPEPGMEPVEALDCFQYVNIASARTRGIELQGRVQLSRTLVATIGYTLSDTLDREADRELPDRARHRGSFELRVRPIDRLQLAAHGELVGERKFYTADDDDPDDDDEVRRADRYAWIGARAEVDVGGHLSIFAGADNLADAGDTQYLPIPPRSFYAGLRGHYDGPDEPERLVP